MLSFVLLFGVTAISGNPWSKLVMEEAWKEEITYDWDNLDHLANFKHWAATFGKEYKTLDEEAERFDQFLTNWERINTHNIENEESKKESYTLRMNQFGDLSSDEFKVYVNGPSGSCLKHRTVQERIKMIETTPKAKNNKKNKANAVPDSVDWTNVNGKSYVTPVKNQGQCGSCWAFSTTGAIESRFAITYGKTGSDITSLSEQQLVDCSGSYGNDGCNGGLMDDGFKYAAGAGGLCSESEYPYTAKDGTCKANTCGTRYDPVKTYVDVTHDNEQSLMSAVSAGPVSIAIEADQSAFQFYSSGVLTGRCGDRLDHGVLAVGYGTDGDTKYWKVKNSWGTTWGQEGYVLLCRECQKNGQEGQCGILATPSFPDLAY